MKNQLPSKTPSTIQGSHKIFVPEEPKIHSKDIANKLKFHIVFSG